MASVTVTETGLARLTVYLNRYPGQPDSVVMYAESATDHPEIVRRGRVKADVDITALLTPAQLQQIAAFLTLVEGKVKTEWQIP